MGDDLKKIYRIVLDTSSKYFGLGRYLENSRITRPTVQQCQALSIVGR